MYSFPISNVCASNVYFILTEFKSRLCGLSFGPKPGYNYADLFYPACTNGMWSLTFYGGILTFQL